MLSILIAGETVKPAARVLRPGQTLEEAEEVLHDAKMTGALVSGGDQELLGVLTASDVATIPEGDRRTTYVIDLMSTPRTR